jgi:hypothetical protein
MHELYGRDNPNEALTLLFVGPRRLAWLGVVDVLRKFRFFYHPACPASDDVPQHESKTTERVAVASSVA